MADKAYIVIPEAAGYYRVTSPEGRTYNVNMTMETCDCADFLYRGQDRPCKHINMVKKLIERGVIEPPIHRVRRTA